MARSIRDEMRKIDLGVKQTKKKNPRLGGKEEKKKDGRKRDISWRGLEQTAAIFQYLNLFSSFIIIQCLMLISSLNLWGSLYHLDHILPTKAFFQSFLVILFKLLGFNH